MACAKLKCCGCKERFPRETMIKINGSNFHSIDCATQHAYKNKGKGANIVRKAQKKKDNDRKKELRTRSEWFDIKQKLVNQYVREVKETGEPCCTCGNVKGSCDAGHYKCVGRGGADRRRFVLMNLHRQCRHCNGFSGGKPVEYREFLINRYGIDKVLWLEDESQHPTLKELFPTTDDIEKGIIKYRKLLRGSGIKPKA